MPDSTVSAALATEARAQLCTILIVDHGSTWAGIMTRARLKGDEPVHGTAGYDLTWVAIATADTAEPQQELIRAKCPDVTEHALPDGTRGQIAPGDIKRVLEAHP